jgi:hypothetical protein
VRRYPMTLSAGVRLLTTLVSALVLSVPLLVWGAIPGVRLGGGGEMARWLVLLAPLIVLGTWALSPVAVELEGGELRVLRRAWRAASWPLADVERVSVLPPRWLRGAIRTFGNGGLFGFSGWYYKKGAFRLFATRMEPLVEVVIGGKRLVLSADDADRLVEGLLAVAPRARVPSADPHG